MIPIKRHMTTKRPSLNSTSRPEVVDFLGNSTWRRQGAEVDSSTTPVYGVVRMRNGLIPLSSIIAVAVVAACSGSSKSSFDDPNASSGGVGSSGNNGFGSSGSSGNGAVCAPAKGNFDIPGNNCDDDDDGTVDNPPTCDGSLSKGGSAEDFA